MSRLDRMLAASRRDRAQFVIIELVIVFLGVYGAFALQDYSQQRAVDAEREKVLVGVKEDLEYFRIFFPTFTARDQIEGRRALIEEGRYRDYSEWRFLQPQYDYTAIEYALVAAVSVVDYELNAGLAEIYQELQKLRHAEELMTRLAMAYQPLPPDLDTPEAKLSHRANFQGFRLLNQRAADRAEVMERIARLSTHVLADVNRRFPQERLREIELELIGKRLGDLPDGERDALIPFISDAFPGLGPADIEAAIR